MNRHWLLDLEGRSGCLSIDRAGFPLTESIGIDGAADRSIDRGSGRLPFDCPLIDAGPAAHLVVMKHKVQSSWHPLGRGWPFSWEPCQSGIPHGYWPDNTDCICIRGRGCHKVSGISRGCFSSHDVSPGWVSCTPSLSLSHVVTRINPRGSIQDILHQLE